MQYFADRDMFCAGRVTEEDLQRVAAATGGTVQTSVNNIVDEVLLSFPLIYLDTFVLVLSCKYHYLVGFVNIL